MESYRKDLDEFCRLLNQHQVEYMLVGGLAVNFHGYQRATGDVDIWYNPSTENYRRLLEAIRNFGFDTAELSAAQRNMEHGLIRLPLNLFSIELLSMIDGKFSFPTAYQHVEKVKILETLANVISYDHLIENKIMSRRPKDLEDIRQLELRRNKRS